MLQNGIDADGSNSRLGNGQDDLEQDAVLARAVNQGGFLQFRRKGAEEIEQKQDIARYHSAGQKQRPDFSRQAQFIHNDEPGDDAAAEQHGKKDIPYEYAPKPEPAVEFRQRIGRQDLDIGFINGSMFSGKLK